MLTIQTKLSDNVRVSRFLKFCGGTSYLRTLSEGEQSTLKTNLTNQAKIIEAYIANDFFRLSRLHVVESIYKSSFNSPAINPLGTKVTYALVNPFGSSTERDTEAFVEYITDLIENDEEFSDITISTKGTDGLTGGSLLLIEITV